MELSNKEIVIARYEEDLSWVNNTLFNGYSESSESSEYKITCYNKGNSPVNIQNNNINVIKLDNIGSGEYAYIYHIVNNYDTLADLTVF